MLVVFDLLRNEYKKHLYRFLSKRHKREKEKEKRERDTHTHTYTKDTHTHTKDTKDNIYQYLTFNTVEVKAAQHNWLSTAKKNNWIILYLYY